MKIDLEVAAFSVCAGVAAWFVLIPLITSIPRGLLKNWRQQSGIFSELEIDSESKYLSQLTFGNRVGFSLIAAMIGFLVFQIRGVSQETAFLVGYLLCLLLLATINWRSMLLPDDIVLPILWVGLIYSASVGQGADRIYGAAMGFSIVWLLHWSHKHFSGKEGIGRGDMKVFAMSGAWLGLGATVTLILVWSVFGFLMAIGMKVLGFKLGDEHNPGYVPTGVMHLVASLVWILGFRV